MQILGVFKIQGICYIMGAEIFKIEEEMTEKMKPQDANPPPKMHFHDLQWKHNLFPMLVEGKIKVVIYPWP